MTEKRLSLPYTTYMEVVWDDAASDDGWVDVTLSSDPTRIITRGWLIKKTDTYLMLAASLHVDTASTVGSTQIIPIGMIVTCREIKVSNARSVTRHNIHPEPSAEEVHREPSNG